MASSVSKDDILDALRAALDPPPPSPEEGWRNMAQMVEALGVSEPVVRRRIRMMRDRLETMTHKGLMFYRLKNGKVD